MHRKLIAEEAPLDACHQPRARCLYSNERSQSIIIHIRLLLPEPRLKINLLAQSGLIRW